MSARDKDLDGQGPEHRPKSRVTWDGDRDEQEARNGSNSDGQEDNVEQKSPATPQEEQIGIIEIEEEDEEGVDNDHLGKPGIEPSGPRDHRGKRNQADTSRSPPQNSQKKMNREP